jgi:hypothetical protein
MLEVLLVSNNEKYGLPGCDGIWPIRIIPLQNTVAIYTTSQHDSDIYHFTTQ